MSKRFWMLVSVVVFVGGVGVAYLYIREPVDPRAAAVASVIALVGFGSVWRYGR